MGYHYRNQHELIAYFSKGPARPLNDRSVPDVLRARRVRGGYPTEKPLALLDVLVRQATRPGELVVDPFCGSGSTGRAALLTGRRFAGSDIDETAVAIAREHLNRIEEGLS